MTMLLKYHVQNKTFAIA